MDDGVCLVPLSLSLAQSFHFLILETFTVTRAFGVPKAPGSPSGNYFVVTVLLSKYVWEYARLHNVKRNGK